MQPSQEGTQNSEEQLQPSDTDTQTSENNETEKVVVQTSANKGTETPENTEVETAEEIVENSSENKETASSENTEAQSPRNMKAGTEDTGTQTSRETQVSEDTERGSSHHTGDLHHIVHSEYTKIENNRYVQSEPAQKAASENSGSAESSKPAPPSASVSLHGEKTQ
ncbi:MAG TPA: hypothetical protein VFM18_14490, partial [Methanosarcina sp.]|nr:hypothetical protein [Methanosarcina sp.]